MEKHRAAFAKQETLGGSDADEYVMSEISDDCDMDFENARDNLNHDVEEEHWKKSHKSDDLKSFKNSSEKSSNKKSDKDSKSSKKDKKSKSSGVGKVICVAEIIDPVEFFFTPFCVHAINK